MKRKIKLIDKINNKVIESEINVRNTLHFEVQKNTRAHVFKDKTKYTRKIKHKKDPLNGSF